MLTRLTKILGLLALTLIGSAGLWFFHDQRGAQRAIARLQRENEAMQAMVERLGSERRAAEVLVLDRRDEAGVAVTELLFVEYDRAGNSLPPRSFTVRGRQVHVDALVIKFERHFVREGDPLRGHSLALFQRIYGDAEKPSEAAVIDPPSQAPEVYRGPDPRMGDFERALWQDFWRMLDDAELREQRGVRVVHGQGVFAPFQPGRLYTITLEADGGLSLASEPLRGIYLEALRRRGRT